MPNPTGWIPRNERVWDVLVREAQAVGINPTIAAEVIFFESHWNAAVKNMSGADYSGLNQMGRPELAGLGLTPEQWRSMGADQQLPFIFQFWKQRSKSVPIMWRSAAHLYAANFLPARVHSNTDDVDYPLTRAGEGFYESNAVLDAQKHGFISIRDLGMMLQRKEENNPVDWGFISDQIARAMGRAGVSPSPSGGTFRVATDTADGGGSNTVVPLLVVGGLLWSLWPKSPRR